MSSGPHHPLPVGALVKQRYRICREIGAGGMGLVYEAFDESLGRPVALKLLHPSLAHDETIARRFVNEARALASIRSDHIAEIYETDRTGRIGDHEDAPFLAMEFLRGEDLATLLEQHGSLSYAEAVEYVLEALIAVAEAHARGIVHRDLKPANLFLAEEADGARRIKVLDFGISKVSGDLAGPQRVTTESSVLGTPAYMSPEQLRQASSVDGRADIWSIGVILYELITGRLPFQCATTGALFAAILQDAPQPMGSLVEVPPELDAVVLRCIEKAEDARWQTVTELANALGPFGTEAAVESVRRVDRLASNLKRTSLLPDRAISSPRAPSGQTGHASAATLHPRTRHSRVSRSALLAGALLGSIVAVGVAVRSRPAPAASPQATQAPADLAPAMSPAPSTPAAVERRTARVIVHVPADVKVVYAGRSVTLDEGGGMRLEGEIDSYQSVKLIRGAVAEERVVSLRADGSADPSTIEWSTAPSAPPSVVAPTSRPKPVASSASSAPAPKGAAHNAAQTFRTD